MPPSEADVLALQALELAVQPLSGPLVRLLDPPPPSQAPPALPPRHDATPFPGWCVDTFTIPAAFPRSARGSTISPGAEGAAAAEPASADRTGKDNVGEVYERLMRAQFEGTRRQVDADDAEEVGEQVPLWVSVNRYSRAKREPVEADPAGGDGLTLVWAHANGFHKGQSAVQRRPSLALPVQREG